MFIELCSLLVAILLPILTKVPLAIAMIKEKGYDNRYPRQQQQRLMGFGARAKASHENAFEALILYAPIIVLTMALNSTSTLSQYGALGWILSRLVYHTAYLLNWPLLRSVVWLVSYSCTMIILLSLLFKWNSP
ncbi:MAPEG family protein [Alteromonadaceae bacterium BrNp21-10]|nr:MAPEG family protein [Alteromonadaceae bacterium BrNp21-10]